MRYLSLALFFLNIMYATVMGFFYCVSVLEGEVAQGLLTLVMCGYSIWLAQDAAIQQHEEDL